MVERVVRDRRDDRILLEINPVPAEVHDLAHGHEVPLGAQVVRLPASQDCLLVVIGLLPVGRGAGLGDQYHRCRRVRVSHEIAHHKLYVCVVAVVVDAGVDLVLARDRALNETASELVPRRDRDGSEADR